MKFNFRKISALGCSLILAGMSIASPIAAAAYPAPFVSGGTANVAIVYGTGTGVSALDVVQAGNIQSNLQSKMGTSVGTSSTVSGDARSLASGSDLLYLNDDLAENVQTITKSDLPTTLADGTFTDDNGGTFEYEQTIAVGTSGLNAFTFGNSNNDFDDPALMINLSTSTSTPMYTWTLSFDKATNLTSSISEGEEIKIFGKTYTIGTATDVDTLVLLGGSSATRINVGETATLTVGGVDYTVSLDGLSSATTTEAGITVNGQYKTFTQGQTKTFTLSDATQVDVYAKTVFRTGDSGTGYVEVEIGSGKLTFETGGAVKFGTDNTDIDGTLVTITPTPAGSTPDRPGFGNVTKIQIAVAAQDSDANHILVGGAFTDPVFETLKIDFSGVYNGPVFEAEEDTGRIALKLTSGGSRELQVEMTDSSGVVKTIPFTYNNIMQSDERSIFHTIEGDNMTDEDYFILNSGDYEHLMRVKHLNFDDITGKVQILDVFTGTTYTVGDTTGVDFTGDVHTQTGGQNLTINSQTYTITNTSKGSGTAAGVVITRAGAATSANRAVFPYIELVAGEDFPRVAFINQTNRFNDSTGDKVTAGAAGTRVTGKTYDLPTGTVQFAITNGSNADGSAQSNWVEYGATPTGGSITWANISGSNKSGGNHTSIQVGEGWYIFGTTTLVGAVAIGAANVTVNNVTLSTWLNATNGAPTLPGDGKLLSPAIMLVEAKDKSDGDARNVVVINTTDDATYSEQSGDVLFSGTSQYVSESWDETKLKGYLTNYGTYALRDQIDTNIHLARLTYTTKQMYADVYFAEPTATITAGSTGGGASQLGDVLVKDSEVSSVATKNLIVVGGSCINSAAASLVGGAYCSAAWTTATNVGTGEFLIKGYASSTITNKIALLVAGYDAADTVNAATYLRNQALDTSKEYKGTSATSATLVTTESA